MEVDVAERGERFRLPVGIAHARELLAPPRQDPVGSCCGTLFGGVIARALAAAFVLTSPAFHAGGTIPARFTCDGANVSPPLRWTAPPRGTVSLSLTVVDPDAPGGTFVHWRVAALPSTRRALPAGSHLGGPNSSGGTGWTGPCPPPGPAHHYHFELRARNARGKVLAVATLVALYRR